jgi:hypothetical protein
MKTWCRGQTERFIVFMLGCLVMTIASTVLAGGGGASDSSTPQPDFWVQFWTTVACLAGIFIPLGGILVGIVQLQVRSIDRIMKVKLEGVEGRLGGVEKKLDTLIEDLLDISLVKHKKKEG